MILHVGVSVPVSSEDVISFLFFLEWISGFESKELVEIKQHVEENSYEANTECEGEQQKKRRQEEKERRKKRREDESM